MSIPGAHNPHIFQYLVRLLRSGDARILGHCGIAQQWRSKFVTAVLLLACILESGCTSLTWEEDGEIHGIGLMAARSELAADGTRTLRRFALGASLDLTSTGGYTLGWMSLELVNPSRITVTDEADLIDTYVKFIDGRTLRKEKPVTHWQWLFVRASMFANSEIIRRSVGGAALGWENDFRGATFGFGASDHVLVNRVGMDAVLSVVENFCGERAYLSARLR